MILRVYESHDVLGKVTHYCPPNDRDHALWRVRFGDESDEVDDLDFEELCVALEKYNMNRSSLAKLYKLAMSAKLKEGSTLVTVCPRREIVRGEKYYSLIQISIISHVSPCQLCHLTIWST